MNKKIIFLSNNSASSSIEIKNKLENFGLSVNERQIYLATELLGPYVLEKYGPSSILLNGSEKLEESLRNYGHRFTLEQEEVTYDFEVFSRDTELNYEKIKESVKYILKGSNLLITNPDLSHPDEIGYPVPETGSLISVIKSIVGDIDIENVGKPANYPFEVIWKKYGGGKNKYLMIGDNPYTDIKGAKDFGMKALWLSNQNAFPLGIGDYPDYEFHSINDLYLEMGKVKNKSFSVHTNGQSVKNNIKELYNG